MIFKGLLNYLKNNLPQRIKEDAYHSYEIFGKEVENAISDVIEDYLKHNNINYIIHKAKNKNDFPDLLLTINDITYALEYKAGKSDAGPNNDMGTINMYHDKINTFGDNIYCVFLKYSIERNIIFIDDIYFDKIYRFIGHTKVDKTLLKYRKKDGNLRPKVWSDFSNHIIYFNTLEEFKNAIENTNQYRSEQIVYQYLDILDTDALKRINTYVKKLLE